MRIIIGINQITRAAPSVGSRAQDPRFPRMKARYEPRGRRARARDHYE